MTTRRALKSAASVPFRRVEGLDAATSQFQRATEESSVHARRDQQSRGVAVTIKPTAAGTIQVAHKLGRKPRGVRVDAQRGAAIIFTEDKRTTRYLTLTVSGAGELDLWVW